MLAYISYSLLKLFYFNDLIGWLKSLLAVRGQVIRMLATDWLSEVR